MLQRISDQDIRVRIERDNPWWADPTYRTPESKYRRRLYLAPFSKLSLNFDVRRATVLLGPRRVGKTVMLKQLIQTAIEQGVEPRQILYASIDTPVFSGISLNDFLSYMPKLDTTKPAVIIFDEIQYLKDWEVHLKDLVDSFPNIKFIASGSAAAALRLKSRESGAGRFSDFMLPPLTFYEFLDFLDEANKFISSKSAESDSPIRTEYQIQDIVGLNARFIDYLNFGGYPEAALNSEIRANPEQFIRNDIIDKVLLKDLPSLYGINEIQELNRLFSFLAFNSGNEASLENISQGSGITKPTIKKYIEYLESAFLIIKLSTVDDNCKSMTRERNFKVYLNNPSMRAALFAPVQETEAARVGHLAESAIFSQWQHSPAFRNLHYARWRNEGEVDVVFLSGPTHTPLWIGEMKWSDRVTNHQLAETKSLAQLLRKHPKIQSAFVTTKTVQKVISVEGRDVRLIPTAAYCYTVGRNITSRLDDLLRK